MSYKILILPDGQDRPGVPRSHWVWAGKLAKRERPDIIINIGDFYDMHSLSSWDKGKKADENRRYKLDIDRGNETLGMFMEHINYHPDLHFCIGNHEQRIERYVNANKELEGVLSYDDFDLDDWGWDIHDFLKPVRLCGVDFAHFFPRTSTGNVTPGSQRSGASNALNQIKANMVSCVAGHKQGYDYSDFPLHDRVLQGIICGSFYQHDEGYRTVQGNTHFRGCLMLNFRNSKNGYFAVDQWPMWRLREAFNKAK